MLFKLTYLLLLTIVFICKYCKLDAEKLYNNQFPDNSGSLKLPPMVLMSLYMGKVKYSHLPLLLTSMKLNSNVDFVLINIVKDKEDSHHIRKMKSGLSVDNFLIESVTFEEFSIRVQNRLNISVSFDNEWSYKLCDYKPTIAHLFPEIVKDNYKYWGFVDMDVVWGNFTRFSYLFQGQFPIVITGWWRSTGAATFLQNTDSFKTLFLQDPLYVKLLQEKTYHNLDEGGTQVNPENVIDNGIHSFNDIMESYASKHSFAFNKGRMWRDHLFYDEQDSVDWAGSIIWHKGTLKIIHSTPEFPHYRELLFYHRVNSNNYPDEIRPQILKDMLDFGFLLPHLIPVFSRFMCFELIESDNSSMKAMQSFVPYDISCFDKFIT